MDLWLRKQWRTCTRHGSFNKFSWVQVEELSRVRNSDNVIASPGIWRNWGCTWRPEVWQEDTHQVREKLVLYGSGPCSPNVADGACCCNSDTSGQQFQQSCSMQMIGLGNGRPRSQLSPKSLDESGGLSFPARHRPVYLISSMDPVECLSWKCFDN